MRRVRRVLRLASCGWLAAQLATFVAAPLAIAVAGQEPAGALTHPCCPGLKPGQMCPMHHTREGIRTCTITAACGSPDAALVSLLAHAGVLAPSSTLVALAVHAERLPAFVAARIQRPRLPDSPPPRA